MATGYMQVVVITLKRCKKAAAVGIQNDTVN